MKLLIPSAFIRVHLWPDSSATNIDGQPLPTLYQGKFYGQAERAISNGQLNVLPRLHIRPINVVVFDGPY